MYKNKEDAKRYAKKYYQEHKKEMNASNIKAKAKYLAKPGIKDKLKKWTKEYKKTYLKLPRVIKHRNSYARKYYHAKCKQAKHDYYKKNENTYIGKKLIED